MSPVFVLLAAVTVAGAVATMTLRNLVHCALALTVAFGGLASLYLQLDAQFVGFAQLLIYIGAVAILIVFAIMLTRGTENPGQPILSSKWCLSLGVAVAVFGTLAGVLLSSKAVAQAPLSDSGATVRQIGDQLMTHYVLPLEVIGLLLTVALIGAVIIAMREPPPPANVPPTLTDSATHSLTH